MLLHGLASIVRHRTDDERSAHYEALLQAEQVRCMACYSLVFGPCVTEWSACYTLGGGSALLQCLPASLEAKQLGWQGLPLSSSWCHIPVHHGIPQP